MTDLIDDLQPAIDSACAAEQVLADKLDATLNGFQTATLEDLLKAHFFLDWLYEMGETFKKMANKWYPTIDRLANERMQAADMDGVKVYGHNVTPEIDVFVNVLKENREAALDWLKAHPVGRELVHEEYNARAFTSFIKEMIGEGKLPPAFVKTTLIPTIKTRKVPGKSA